jgi:MSHA biogenesis protein MshM
MYMTHFGLREMPFGLTPDTAYVFSTRGHQSALNTLLLAAGAGEGFVKITGEIGTGKTMLCRRFLRSLPTGFVSCYLPNPTLTPRTLMLALGEELGVSLPATADVFTLYKAVNLRLLQYAIEGRRVIVCLDEAQALPLDSMEALRLLSNLETEKRKLMQVVLFGQPELDAMLQSAELRQLRQRIAFASRLVTMNSEEVGHYLAHRMRVAGHVGPSVFSPGSITQLGRASGGTPRVLNILANKSLLAVFGEGGSQVEARHVRAAVADAEDTRISPRGWFDWRLR